MNYSTLLDQITLELESISIAGSIGFLLVFSTVNFVAYKRSADVKSKKSITLLSVILFSIATLVLIVQQFATNVLGVSIALGII